MHTESTLIEPGKSIIHLKWSIPKTESATSYEIQSMLEIYEDTIITSEATLNTYVRTQKMPIDGITESIRYVTDAAGNSIARPALLYASNDAEGAQFRVSAPDGSCVIGGESDCLVTESTANRRGGLDSVIVDGQMYRVRYSGADNVLERFSITSLDSVAGDWKIELLHEDGFVQYAEAEEQTLLTVKYRAEQGSIVTVKGISTDEKPDQIQVKLFNGTSINSKPFTFNLIQGVPLVSNYLTQYNAVSIKYDLLTSAESVDYELQQNIEKFFGKSNYVADQLLDIIDQAIDAKDPQLLILMILLVHLILIRTENWRIRFFDLRRMMKARILALILIGIMLSSTFIPFADAATIGFEITGVNGTPEYRIIQPNQYKLDLSDGIVASLGRQPYEQEQQPYRIDLFDGILASFDKKYNDLQNDNKKLNSRMISVKLNDGVGTSSIKQHHDNDRFIKIISIKQDHDRKAIWERIFPADRIRSEEQSMYKVIMEDNDLSHLQVNEFELESPVDNELLETPFANDVDKFVGKANYAAESITDKIQRLADVDRFIGKSLYVGNQISVNAQHLTDVDKFIGKSLYVGNQISVNAQHLTDVDKFVGKSLYVANALVGEIERLSDAEKFIGKSQYVSSEITIQVYQAVDSRDPTILLLVLPFAG